MATESAKYLSVLHKQVDKYFVLDEVRTISFDIGIDYENIPGETRSAFIRNLILSMARQNRLPELISHLRDARPSVAWEAVPNDFELPQDMVQEQLQAVVNYHVYGDYVNGDKVAGDKVGGDKISVGNVSGEGIAIGRDSSASVEKTTRVEQPSSQQHPANVPVQTVEQAVANFQNYMTVASGFNPDLAVEIEKGVNLILASADDSTFDALHLKLLCLGKLQFAKDVEDKMPGVTQRIEQLITAVQQK